MSRVYLCTFLLAVSIFGPVHEAQAIKRKTVERAAVIAGLAGVVAGAAAIRAGAVDACTRACGISDTKRCKQYLFGAPLAGLAAYAAAYLPLWQWYKKTGWPRDEAERLEQERLRRVRNALCAAYVVRDAKGNSMVVAVERGTGVVDAACETHLRSPYWLVRGFEDLEVLRNQLRNASRDLQAVRAEMDDAQAARARELDDEIQQCLEYVCHGMKILRADNRYDRQFNKLEKQRLQEERNAAERARRDAEYARQQAEQARYAAERARASNEEWQRWDRYSDWWSGRSRRSRRQPEIHVNVHNNADNNAGARANAGPAPQAPQPEVHVHHSAGNVQSPGVASSGPVQHVHLSSGGVQSAGAASSGPIVRAGVAQVAVAGSRQRRRRSADGEDDADEDDGN